MSEEPRLTKEDHHELYLTRSFNTVDELIAYLREEVPMGHKNFSIEAEEDEYASLKVVIHYTTLREETDQEYNTRLYKKRRHEQRKRDRALSKEDHERRLYERLKTIYGEEKS